MPSGDTVQSMFFSMVMVLWYGADPGVMLLFHVLVAVSRVYFMCHWLGDTLAATLITYAVQPLPAEIAVKWFIAGVVQGVLMGLLVHLVYKPKPEDRRSTGIAEAPGAPRL